MSCFKDPGAVIQHAFGALRPGGYFELQDGILPWQAIDDSFEGTALQKWINLAVDGAAKLGRPWTNSKHYKQYMESAGFVDIREHHFQWPLSPWPKGMHHKMLGMWFQQDLLKGLDGISMAVLSRGAGMTREEIQAMLIDVRKELEGRNVHAYMPV
jgi:hypothetical protein